jgi:hypothetical protein
MDRGLKMADIRRSFVLKVADIIDSLQFGEKRPPWAPEGKPFRYSRKYIHMANELARLNAALEAGRTLGILPEEFSKLSQSEKSAIGKELRAYHAIDAIQNVRECLCKILRDRLMSEELLSEIFLSAEEIKFSLEAGTWKEK